MRFQALSILLIVLCVAGVSQAGEAFEGEEQFRRFYATAGVGFHYSTGDYGDPEKSHVYAPSLFGKLEYEPQDRHSVQLTLSVPYVVLDGDVVFGEGSGSGGADTSFRHGIGDITTTLTYSYFVPEGFALPTIIEPSIKFKIPSGSEKKDIGTGHTDVTLGLELTKVFGSVSVFGSGAYRAKGGSYNDIWLASLGTSVRLARLVSVGLAYDFRQASTNGIGDSHELVPMASFRVSERLRFGPYGVIGLSTNSPDWGLGGMFTVNF